MSVFIPTGERAEKSRALADDPEPYKELAKKFGVCWQRIRQIEFRALEKIRAAIEQEAAAAGVSPSQWMLGE